MRLPFDWLKQFVDISLSTKETANLLTLLGLEVESQEEIWGSPVFDIKVTPQRGDCLCAIGVARELAASLELPLNIPSPQISESGPPAAPSVSVTIEDPDLCPRYSARLIRGVKVGLSPGWVRQRLEQCGVRPINNIVDVTNLVMLEQGQPLHAFDADLLRPASDGGPPAIIVRRAKKREEIITLDGESRTLNEDMLVIADGERAVALAGVMGGSNSEVHDGTATVLLESAHFAPTSIRRTARALGITSEASYRFERRVDPGGTVFALDLASDLILQFAGGEIAQGVIDVCPKPVEEPKLSLHVNRANELLGTDLSAEQMADYLSRLELKVKIVGESLKVQVPSLRGDLAIEEDLIEEVARMHGYDNIPSRPLMVGASVGKPATEGLVLEAKARKILLACGLNEAITYNLEGPRDMQLAGFSPDHPLCQPVIVRNPKVEEYSRLRTSMLPSLLALLSRNWRRGLQEVRAFEIGRLYLPRPEEQLPRERQSVGIAMLAGPRPVGWGKDEIDFYAIKGMVEEFLTLLQVEGVSCAPLEHPTFAVGRAAQVLIGEKPLGILGQVRESVLANYDLPKDTFLAELDLERVIHLKRETPAYKQISRFPSVERDLALLVPLDCPAAKVEATLRAKGGELLENLALFDLYEGKSLPTGTHSLAYSLTFRARERTLTEAEIEQIITDMEKALLEIGVKVRRQ
ncbi:MAG: phenylalanine--tRNA ligase subunit beta [Armatimonadetes bacterium]|nr:phenylalanine--tRNA ligase subunit beta [Armatimonadota bacterium]NIM23558.1 phenylalanine--tRNA ligase subunit beta [Armatimonadota bacterium]NIM67424.1 phenylalanine--tRNA ligase subunit beta [Armatimonadota bacterium]NIM75925.1 phenylalanine--tRNA ligase subunit beta [Armatimonadota bacterium]NIN05610.1 phenylalanine--tRNA ligase subunit beta [Armatimonadota bacterium]